MPQPESDEKSGEMLPQIRSTALVALGSNRPVGKADARETVIESAENIAQQLGVIRAISRLYRTPAFPAGSGPDFVNAALLLETELAPDALLAGLHHIEQSFGRVRRERWAARALDLDLLAYDDLVLPDPETHQKWVNLPLDQQMRQAPDQMILPHPRLAERAFVLVPLADVAPHWRHPVTGLTVLQMLSALPEESTAEVIAL